MIRFLPLTLLVISCAAPPPRFPTESAIVRLRRDVEFLASDEMKGRNNGTPEGALAAEYVAQQMADAGLKPGGENGTWFQDVRGRGRNVIGVSHGAMPGSWIVIGAHHDGLGERQGRIYNGADDNASGVAVMLEVARRMNDGRLPEFAGILFCSFDAEEDGLVGSSHFVKSGLYPVDTIHAMICMDLVGGSFLPGDERRVFALGSESSAFLFDWIGKERARKGALEVERAGIYMIEPMGPIMARSDYSPFRMKQVPFVFFSTGTPWYYHKPEDDVERLDFGKMERLAEVVERLAVDAAHAGQNTVWREPAPDLGEDARLLASACKRVLEDPAIRATDRQRAAVAEALESLTGKGEVKKEKVQQVMALLFVLAGAQKPAH